MKFKLFFSLSTAFAQLGVVDIAMRGVNKGANANELIQVPAEQNKLYSIVFIKDSGERFEKKIRLNSRSSKLNFSLLPGFYKVVIVELTTGFTWKYTINLQ